MQLSPFAGLPGFDEEPSPPTLDAHQQASAGPQELRWLQGARRSLDGGLLAAAGGTATGGTSTSFLARSATVANPFDVAELLSHIELLKPSSSSLASVGSTGHRAITDSSSGAIQWIQPSGPRNRGQGVEEVEQGVMLAEPTPTGGALLRVTLLAAGFIIGPSGSSVRDVCRCTDTDIKSWTQDPDARCPRSCRVFKVEGPRQGVARAVGILCDAVGRYKELCEGQYAGQSVARTQHIGGVDFSYQPPPRSIVPFAASLKGQPTARRQGSGQAGPKQGTTSRRPPTAPHHAPGQKGLSRAASLGTPAPAAQPPSAHAPSPSPSLGRSTSLPHPASRPASRAGSAAVEAAHHSDGSPPSHRHSMDGGRGGLPPAGPSHHSRTSQPSGTRGSHTDPTAAAAETAAAAAAAAAAAVACGGGQACRPDLDWEHRSAGAGGLKRSASAGPAAAHTEHHVAVPSPALKLDKNDVMRSVFGAAPAAVPGASTTTARQDLSQLLQQLALQDAQEQAAATAAAQAGSSTQYEFSEPGVLLPTSLSPLAAGSQHLRPFGSGSLPMAGDAQLAAQGLASNANMLQAVAQAWQDSQLQQTAAQHKLLQLAAAGLLAPLAAGGPSTLPSGVPPPATQYPPGYLAAAGRHGSQPLAPHPSLDAAIDAMFAAAAASGGPPAASHSVGGASSGGQVMHGGIGGCSGYMDPAGADMGGEWQDYMSQGQHMPLSALQPPNFSPGSPVGSTRVAGLSPGTLPNTSSAPGLQHNPPPAGGAWGGMHPRSPLSAPAPSDSGVSVSSGRASMDSSTEEQGQKQEQREQRDAPGTPRQDMPSSAAAMPTPPSASVAAALAPGSMAGIMPTPTPSSASSSSNIAAASASSVAPPVAPSGPGLGNWMCPTSSHAHTDSISNALASAFALLPGDPAGEDPGASDSAADDDEGRVRLSPFSSAPFLPLSGAALARAASVPGPQGSCTPLDRLQDMLSLARANSYAGACEPECTGGSGGTGLHRGPSSPQASGLTDLGHAGLHSHDTHGSNFCSAFSPRWASEASSPAPAPGFPVPPLAPPAPMLGQQAGHSTSTGDLLGELDRMVEAMF